MYYSLSVMPVSSGGGWSNYSGRLHSGTGKETISTTPNRDVVCNRYWKHFSKTHFEVKRIHIPLPYLNSSLIFFYQNMKQFDESEHQIPLCLGCV